MSSSNCVRIKAYSPFKTKGCRTGLKKEASKAFDIAGALLGNTSGHWFGLRTSSLDGGPKAKMFPEFTQMSLLAGYYWFFNLTDLPLFQSHFSFFFLFYVIIRCSSGWRNTVCGDSLYKGKGCFTESRIFELSVIKMHALFVKEIVKLTLSFWR